MSFPFDPNAGAPAPALPPATPTHYQHHLAASIVLGSAYGGLTCKNRPDGTPEWTLYFWCPDGSSMGLTCTGNPMELVQQAGDTLAPHRGDKVFPSLQELAADDPVSLLMVYEESRRALLSMIPINGHPSTWLPEHGWLLPEGMANVERGDDCSEDGEGFTLDPKEAVTAWWAFFAGARSENERLKGTIQLLERSEKRLSREKEKLSAAVAAQPQWEPWKPQYTDWKDIVSRLMIGQFCVALARISTHQTSFSGTYSSTTQSGTVYPAEHPSFVRSRLDSSLGALGLPPLPSLPGRSEVEEPS